MATTDPVQADAKGVTRRLSQPPAGAVCSASVAREPALEFPGCKPVHVPREAIETFDGRLEFWDAATATAWVCEPNSPYHEEPAETLSTLLARVAGVRGSPIKAYGSMDLRLRDEQGEPRRILQADQSVYLHPLRAKLPGAAAMVVGEHDHPDVVLEVDHTTDVRRGKLGLYESWGFPEVWVEVPEKSAPNRPRGRRRGLTIHVLEGGAYRVRAGSRAFPGWTAEEIHTAMNETTPSARTHAVLERVGAALGAREGTGPDDDPLLRSQRRQGFERGRAEVRAKMVRQILLSRGIEVSAGFPAGTAGFAASSEEEVVAAALACVDEAGFLAALGPPGAPAGGARARRGSARRAPRGRAEDEANDPQV